MQIWDDLFTVGAGITPPLRVNDKNNLSFSKVMPLLKDTDEFIEFPINDTSAVTRKDANNSVIWSVAHTDINAAADEWQGMFWYDSVNDKLFIIAVDVSASPDTHYLATINTVNGTVTPIGSGFQNDNFTGTASDVGTTRATETAGNFFCTHKGIRFEINESTGALVAQTTPIVDGLTSGGSDTNGILEPNGKYYVRSLTNTSALAPVPALVIDRVGAGPAGTQAIPFPDVFVSLANTSFRVWGPNIILSTFARANSTMFGARMYDQADFFRYIDEYLGL